MSIHKHSTQFIRRSRLLFTPIAILAVAWFLFSNYVNVLEIAKTASLGYLILSVVLWCVVNISIPVVTYKLFSVGNPRILLSEIASIHLRRLPAKYIPGGIWHTAARAMDYLGYGFDRRELFNVLAVEHFMALMITAGIGGTGVYFYTSIDYWSFIGLSASLLALTGLAVAASLLFKRFGRDVLKIYIQAFIIHIVVWAIASISFLAYCHAFEFNAVNDSPVYIIFSYMFAWSLGFVSFFTPQGFGVFEVVITDLLTTTASIASVAFIFMGFRFAILVSDLIIYATYLLIKKSRV